MVNKIGINPCPREAAILAETANSKQTSQYIMSGGDECPEENEAGRVLTSGDQRRPF